MPPPLAMLVIWLLTSNSCEPLIASVLSALTSPSAMPVILPLSLMVMSPNFGASAICSETMPVFGSTTVFRLAPE
ncbi:hypothetical protein D3C81_2273640 [compost metagenome]